MRENAVKNENGIILCSSELWEEIASIIEKSAEVKHGEWEIKSEIHRMFDDVDEEFYVECPLCHRVEYIPFEFDDRKMLEYAKEHYPYCHCGAKMDGKQEKE